MLRFLAKDTQLVGVELVQVFWLISSSLIASGRTECYLLFPPWSWGLRERQSSLRIWFNEDYVLGAVYTSMKDIMQGVLIAGGIKYRSDRQRRKTGQGRGDLLETGRGDFPSSPVVKTLWFQCRGQGFVPSMVGEPRFHRLCSVNKTKEIFLRDEQRYSWPWDLQLRVLSFTGLKSASLPTCIYRASTMWRALSLWFSS